MRIGERRLLILATAAVAAGLGAAGALVVGGRYWRASMHFEPQLSPRQDARTPPLECTEIGGPCMRFGRAGECVQNRCVLGGGLCSHDVDCDDENPCTVDRCRAGTCEQSPRQGTCLRSNNEPGQCSEGICDLVAAGPVVCTTDADCPQSNHPCRVFRCDSGTCIRKQREEGESCQVSSGRAGACSQGTCTFGLDQAERCKVVWDPYWGAQRACSKALLFTIEPSEIVAAEHKIAQEIQKEMLYDMKVALVALPDGGYNVVTLNRRPRTDVHGMCDASYVAWNVAFFTANSKWKSRVLQIWTKPYEEGWYLSTSGSRNAIREGRARSGLGWLGVVHVATFRKWLDRSFRPLPSVPFGGAELATAERAAAGAGTQSRTTAAPALVSQTPPIVQPPVPVRAEMLPTSLDAGTPTTATLSSPPPQVLRGPIVTPKPPTPVPAPPTVAKGTIPLHQAAETPDPTVPVRKKQEIVVKPEALPTTSPVTESKDRPAPASAPGEEKGPASPKIHAGKKRRGSDEKRAGDSEIDDDEKYLFKPGTPKRAKPDDPFEQ